MSLNENNEKTADCSYLPHYSSTTSGVNINKSNKHVFEDLCKHRKGNATDLICGYLKINRLRYKHEHIKDLLQRNLLDLLFLFETKIDESFPDAMFMVDNFSMCRSDRNQHGGGVIAYLRSDLAGDRKKQLEFKVLESVGIELTSGGQKCFFSGIYKPPNMPDNVFNTDFSQAVDKIISRYDKYILIGDLNFDMLNSGKSETLMDMCDVFDLKNVVTKATCFTKNSKPTLLDVILTSENTKC